jgi:hypothetical protein
MLAALPDPQLCSGVALNPPAGAGLPSACAWVSDRDLLIGFANGQVNK